MNESAVREYIVTTFPDIGVTDAGGDSYFFTDPEKMFPFATLVTSDAHDQVSDLNRPGVFRLNIGVSKQRFAELFPGPAEYDYAALDCLMPHPVYGKMYWVSVLNPGPATFDVVKQLLAEAHQADMRERRKQAEASS